MSKGQGTKEKDVAKVMECPGSYHSDWSPAPFFDMFGIIAGGYYGVAKKGAEKAGCPVFRNHAAQKQIMVTDMTSFEAVMNQPTSCLQRDGPMLGFGFARMLNDRYFCGIEPAVLCDESKRGPAHELIARMIALREKEFEKACQKALKQGWGDFKTLDSSPLHSSMLKAGYDISMEWLFSVEGNLSGAEINKIRTTTFKPQCDGAVANCLTTPFNACKVDEVAIMMQSQYQMIKECEPFKTHYRAIGRELGFDDDDQIAAHLFFAAMFNGVGGVTTSGMAALVLLAREPEIRGKVMAEVGPFKGTTKALNSLPYFDAFFYESFRYFAPSQRIRVALQDVILPTDDGRGVRVPQGERILAVAKSAHLDETVFKDATVFDPERFRREWKLRNRMYLYGPTAQQKSPIKCPAGDANGFATRLWKTVIAAALKTKGWKVEDAATYGYHLPQGFAPSKAKWVKDV